jgi:hypothetical protein
MPHAHIAQKPRHILRIEDIREQAIPFFQVKPVFETRRNTRGILAAMLKHGKAFIDNRANWTMPEHADNTAHVSSLPGWRQSTFEIR